MRTSLATAAVLAVLVASVAVQTPASTFEVASVRINREVSDRPTFVRPVLQPGGRVLMRNQTLRDLILTAYGVRENELIGGPDWVGSTGFDLEARGAPDMSAETALAMLRTLLADRFSLALRRQRRDLPIYIMIAARNGRPGPQLRPAAAQCADVNRPKGMPPGPPPSEVPVPLPLRVAGTPRRCPSLFIAGHFSGRAVSMDILAGELADVAGRPVVNRTGLTGEFDLDLNYTADLVTEPSTTAAPGLRTALEDQLGLRLEAGRGPVDVLIIDRAQRPTEN